MGTSVSTLSWNRPPESFGKKNDYIDYKNTIHQNVLIILVRVCLRRNVVGDWLQEWLLKCSKILTILKESLLPGTVPVKPSLLDISNISENVKRRKVAIFFDFILTLNLTLLTFIAGSLLRKVRMQYVQWNLLPLYPQQLPTKLSPGE